jgi:uncharacterized Zn finger protein
MSEGKPCCPSCGEAEKHEALNVISLKFYDMSKVTVCLLICRECGTVFDPRYVKQHEL